MFNITIFENIILDLAKAVKVISFYPEGHPSLNKALNKIASDIGTLCSGDRLEIEIAKDHFLVRNTKVTLTNPLIREFLQTLFLRRVNRIIFNCKVSGEELYDFLNILTMDMNTIFSAGGLENIIDSRNIENIALSERQFAKHMEIKSQKGVEITSENQTSEKPVFSLDDLNLNVINKNFEGAGKTEKKKETDEELWERIKTALTDIKKNNNAGLYIENLKDIDNIVNRSEENDKLTIDIFHHLSLDAKDTSVVFGIRKEAEAFVRDKLNTKKIKRLIDIMITNQGKDELLNKIHTIISVLGINAVDVILERLTSSNDIKERRFIINEITKLGEKAFERVIYYLDDERWFVVRNMLTILGFAGQEKYLQDLKKLMDHPDVRVRKELVKTLARIPGRESLKYLREMLKKEGDDVKQLVIFSLGILKDEGSLPEIINELSINSNPSIKKEALLAIGRIGNKVAFEVLKDYATKKTFFNKANNKILRLNAIEGLSEIKGQDTEKVLEKLIRDSDIEIREKAFDALQKIRI
ncbi:MAG: HEAT repeat domain-containing protein [Proteobacteria bacterium]|nr:HEAT repeat domain-containing protein [Pseudomonadota bacterium]